MRRKPSRAAGKSLVDRLACLRPRSDPFAHIGNKTTRRSLRRCRPDLLLAACVLPCILTCLVSPATAEPDWLKQACADTRDLEAPAGAEALVLHRTEEVTIARDGGAVKNRVRLAYRILSVTGESYATLEEWVSPRHRIEDLKGWLILPGSATKELERSDIVEKGHEQAARYYSDDMLLEATLPGARPGATAAFEYTAIDDDWIGAYQSFTFQVQDPVRFAQFSVRVPDGWRLEKGEWMTEGIAYAQAGELHTWTARDLPYRPQEPLMPPWGRLARRVTVAVHGPSSLESPQFPDWGSVAAWCAELMDRHADVDPRITGLADDLTAGLSTPHERFAAVAAYVRDEVRYVAIEIDKNRWEPRDATLTLRNRYGDCKDKATLTRALLHAAGIPSVSVLANTRYPVLPDLPSPFQFNHCIVGIPTAGLGAAASDSLPGSVGDWVFFDPTDPTAQVGRVPSGLEDTVVLPAAAGAAGLAHLPPASAADASRSYRAAARLDAAGHLEASVHITDYGNLAAESAYERSRMPESEQVAWWQKQLARVVSAPTISEFRSGADGDSAWVTFRVRGECAGRSGDLRLLRPDCTHRSEWPDLSAPARVHPIALGSAARTITSISWQLPATWTVEPVAPIHHACPAGRVDCEVSTSGSNLHYASLIERTGVVLEADRYGEAQRFVKAVRSVQGLTLVLRE